MFVFRMGFPCLAFCLSTAFAWAGPPALPAPLSEADFRPFDPEKAEIGRLLFYDKILSGNSNISCGTCHLEEHGTGDGLSLGVGEGGIGAGLNRQVTTGDNRPEFRMPRNSMAMFNLGHASVRTLLHDGRITAADTYGRGFDTPAEEWLPRGLQSVLAAQTLFPIADRVEMAGRFGENDAASARNERIDYAWPLIAERVAQVQDYMEMFRQAYDDIEQPEDLTIVHIANALDDFINAEWRTLDSPFDLWLAGDETALDAGERRGMALFYGEAGCATCHSGPLFTDQAFHALAIPPFGPGRVRNFDPYARDLGRMGETDLRADAYRFRTPPLRNVAETGPWGHNGAFATLEGIVRHHLDPIASLEAWDPSQVVLPEDAAFAKTDFVIWEDRLEMARFRSVLDIEPVSLTEAEIADIVAFLGALTDPDAARGRLGKPESVPSGLPVD